MLPIRCVSPRLTYPLAGLALLAALAGSVGASPLPADGVDTIQRILKQARRFDPSSTSDFEGRAAQPRLSRGGIQDLVRFRKQLREAAERLPSLGEVSRVLLLQDWVGTSYDEFGSPALIDKVVAAVRKTSDEAFARDLGELMKGRKSSDDDETLSPADDVPSMTVAAIKHEVLRTLLNRFEGRLAFFLRNGRPVDRIAAANLAGETMANSRKQYEQLRQLSIGSTSQGQSKGSTAPPASSSSTPQLRGRLAGLSADLKRLTQDRDPMVRVAGIRALSDIEADPRVSIETFHAMLKQSPEQDVRVRRTAAEALGHTIDILSKQRENEQFRALSESRLREALNHLERVLPAAVVGLTDADLTVRRSSVEACRKVAEALHDLVTHQSPQSVLTRFRPMMQAVQAALPVLGAAARSSGDAVAANSDEALRQGAIRRDACHVLESLVLTTQQMDKFKKTGVPPPAPYLEPPTDLDRNNKAKPLPEGVKRRTQRSTGPSQWAVARAGQPTPAPAATLGRPMKLVHSPQLYTAAFQAPKIDELPPPAPLGVNLRSTIESMTRDLEDRDYRVRLAAIDVLETAGEAAAPAIPALVRALSDSNKFVRWAAARTLGKLHPRQADTVVPGLVRLLNDREDLSVRITAAVAIQRYGPAAKEAVSHLARVINRGDKEYIMAVIRAILGIGTDAQAALPSIAYILRDTELPTSVRVEAANALGRFGALAKGQLRTLRDIMENDSDAEVRHAASNAVLAVDRPK